MSHSACSGRISQSTSSLRVAFEIISPYADCHQGRHLHACMCIRESKDLPWHSFRCTKCSRLLLIVLRDGTCSIFLASEKQLAKWARDQKGEGALFHHPLSTLCVNKRLLNRVELLKPAFDVCSGGWIIAPKHLTAGEFDFAESDNSAGCGASSCHAASRGLNFLPQ